jgi:hypothetical protein
MAIVVSPTRMEVAIGEGSVDGLPAFLKHEFNRLTGIRQERRTIDPLQFHDVLVADVSHDLRTSGCILAIVRSFPCVAASLRHKCRTASFHHTPRLRTHLYVTEPTVDKFFRIATHRRVAFMRHDRCHSGYARNVESRPSRTSFNSPESLRWLANRLGA